VLSAREILALARRYSADYVVTPCEAVARSNLLEPVAGPFYSLRDRMRKIPRESGVWVLRVPPSP